MSDYQAQHPIVTERRRRRLPERRVRAVEMATVTAGAAGCGAESRNPYAHIGSGGTYDAPGIHAELAANGIQVGGKRIPRLTTQLGLGVTALARGRIVEIVMIARR